MSNPVLERQFGKSTTTAAATDGSLTIGAPPAVQPGLGTMTVGGVGRSTGLLFVLLLAAAVFGWRSVDPNLGFTSPGLFWGILIGAVILAVVVSFRPNLAPFLAPLYALGEGYVLGAISRFYETAFEGIVLQAIMASLAIFVVMLTLFITRTIRVTNRLRSVVIGATLGIALFYLVSIVLSFFNVNIPFVWDSGPVGIIFSLVVIAVAAFNLLLDFDLIERGVAARAPGFMNWYAGFGLLVTIVWLYLEMLRLLARTRD
jgi:uncharacterized YccA/Bax inhibitor family protein